MVQASNTIKSVADEAAERIDSNLSTAGAASSEDVQAELEQLRRDLAALTQTVASYGSGKIREAGDVSREYVDSAREQLRNAEQDIEAYVHAKPFQSLAIAAGVGYVLALLSRR
ncbi:DUF883 family protein [Peteryoungia ipomoeae]|uniref:DUF883 family protein n=1 Tax=Peteryoungia ipomoeae TaxID=1210932 RepID=A0A4S8NT92_9HYPH|nr:DUF883 family protein [Peteryoungia ipomoeae]THV20673.1 DUF883 family protein [Peteryoungia ipomoeae]